VAANGCPVAGWRAGQTWALETAAPEALGATGRSKKLLQSPCAPEKAVLGATRHSKRLLWEPLGAQNRSPGSRWALETAILARCEAAGRSKPSFRSHLGARNHCFEATGHSIPEKARENSGTREHSRQLKNAREDSRQLEKTRGDSRKSRRLEETRADSRQLENTRENLVLESVRENYSKKLFEKAVSASPQDPESCSRGSGELTPHNRRKTRFRCLAKMSYRYWPGNLNVIDHLRTFMNPE